MSIRRSVASGVKWSAFSKFGRQGTQLVTTIILARLLKPTDFGLVSMAMVVIGFLNIFKDLGTSSAVIQRKNISEDLLSSIYWVNVFFGLLITLAIYIIAPIISEFYNDKNITSLLRALSLTFIISGLSILHQAILERDMAFNKLAKIELIATAIGSVVAISTAIYNAGVWSLVYQSLSLSITTTGLLWIYTHWRPRIKFYLSEIVAVSSYSMNLVGFQIFNYFSRNADYFLIGKYLGAQELGYYTLAYRIMLYPLASVSEVICRVMFPVYSQIQDDENRFRSAYLKVTGAIAMVTFPMMLGLWILAEQFVVSFFGTQWIPVILLLLILAPIGMIQSVATTVGLIYQAKGRTDVMFKWGFITGTITIAAIILGLNWGILGVAIGYAIISLILVYPNFAIPFKLINLPFVNLLQVLWRPFLSSIIMVFCLTISMKVFLSHIDSHYLLPILICIGITSYILSSIFVNRVQTQYLLNAIKEKI